MPVFFRKQAQLNQICYFETLLFSLFPKDPACLVYLPVIAQDKSGYQAYIFLISPKKHIIYCRYSLEMLY